jgi:hypothetical protein
MNTQLNPNIQSKHFQTIPFHFHMPSLLISLLRIAPSLKQRPRQSLVTTGAYVTKHNPWDEGNFFTDASKKAAIDSEDEGEQRR